MINWRKIRGRSVARRGSILAEALVAVTTLVAGVIALGTIINNAVAATGVSKDYLVAQNLITESVESTKIVRATNWMMWPQFKDICWMVTSQAVNMNGSCASPTVAAASNYIAIDTTGRWTLSRILPNRNLDLTVNPALSASYRLYIKTMLPGLNPFPKYVHSNAAGNTPSKFYRSLKAIAVTPNSVLFEAKIQWMDGSKVREIKRNFTIYNYQ